MKIINEIIVNLINYLRNYLKFEFHTEIQIENLVFFIILAIIINHYSSEMHCEFSIFYKT